MPVTSLPLYVALSSLASDHFNSTSEGMAQTRQSWIRALLWMCKSHGINLKMTSAIDFTKTYLQNQWHLTKTRLINDFLRFVIMRLYQPFFYILIILIIIIIMLLIFCIDSNLNFWITFLYLFLLLHLT